MGGYPADSLAEAPDTVSGLLKQRFRWSILPWRQASRDPTEWSPDDLLRGVYYWAAFIFVDLSAGALGMAMERRAPWRDLAWLPIQRFGYRQLMSYVVVKSVVTAVRGYRMGWGKLERRATVAMKHTP